MGIPPGGALPSAGGTGPAELERLRSQVAAYFPVYEARVTPNSLVLLVAADSKTLGEKFDQLRREMWPNYYVPTIRREGGEYLVEIIRRPNRRAVGPWVNVALLVATVISTAVAGGFLWVAYRGGLNLTSSDFIFGGLFFALPLLLILGVHESAHYVLARRHKVDASLPFFLPVPPPLLLFGTFGAFISLREPIPDKRALLDIGASGPLAGFAVAIPVTLAGLALSGTSPVLSVAYCGPTFLGVNYGNLVIGPSFFTGLLSLFFPAVSNLHPLALAGWVGILVTAINLLPAGQLDGGHVFRALLGERSRFVSWAAVILLLGIGILFYQGWIIFAILIFFLGIRHPPPLNDLTALDAKRWAVGGLAAAVLVSGFVLVPITQPSGTFAASSGGVTAGIAPSGETSYNLSLVVNNRDFVAHGFVLSGGLARVVVSSGGGPRNLTGSEFANYSDNSSWSVSLPNGTVLQFPMGGKFSMTPAEYVALDAGRTVRISLVFTNPQPASLSWLVTVGELCNSGGPSPQTVDYLYP